MPIAHTAEQVALQAAIREWAKRAGAIEVVRSQELSDASAVRLVSGPVAARPAAEPWASLAELGVFGASVPVASGGTGGSSADLAAVLAQLADSLVPGPVLPTLLVTLLPGPLAAEGTAPTAGHATTSRLGAHPPAATVRAIAAGQISVAIALVPGTVTAQTRPDGSVQLTGTAGPLLGGGSSTHLLVGATAGRSAVWCLLPANRPGVSLTPVPAADFSRSLADVTFADVVVGPAEVLPGVTTDLVRDLAAALFAVEAAAVAGWCTRTAVEYAAIRQQFGRPIGAFQAIKAVALRQLLGGSAAWRDRTALLVASGERRQLAIERAPDDEGAASVRAAARQAVVRVAGLPAAGQRVALAESGYAAPSWPPPYGLAASPADCLVIDEELTAAGLARPDLVIGGWALAAIFGHGSRAQQDRFAGPTLRAEIGWCQLFSEPEAGSDLAAVRTRAERTDGGWLLTGQKVWTSLARQADWAICLARTDAAVAKHRGLTFFLVAMTSPGIDVRPLRELTGREMFNQVCLDQVFVPDECVVGKQGEGWRIAGTTLASERVAMGTGSSVGDAVEHLLQLASETGAAADPVVRQRLGALVAEGTAVSLLDLQAVLATSTGGDPSPLAAVRKLAGVAHRQAVAEAVLELAGPAGATATDPALQEFLLTRCLSIAGGTTQILLSLVGERLLGLPREEAR